jgi:hypothetical protein
MHDPVFQHLVPDFEGGEQIRASVAGRRCAGCCRLLDGHGGSSLEAREFPASECTRGRQAGGHQKLPSSHKLLNQIHGFLLLSKRAGGNGHWARIKGNLLPKLPISTPKMTRPKILAFVLLRRDLFETEMRNVIYKTKKLLKPAFFLDLEPIKGF